MPYKQKQGFVKAIYMSKDSIYKSGDFYLFSHYVLSDNLQFFFFDSKELGCLLILNIVIRIVSLKTG
jgi:hypothetical protein